MSEDTPTVGDRVTWNEVGKQLFGDTGSVGLLVSVRDRIEGMQGPGGQVLWESGQDTTASLDCLARVSEDGAR